MAAKWLSSKFSFFFIFINILVLVKSWDQVDMELFDIVEEYKDNFYTILGVEATAKTSEIRKAYRRLSLQLHPDRNKEPDAEVKFRRLVAVAEVLKDEDKRKRYDAILRDGLPDWRQPVFYYRRVRKMGFIEFFILLFLILTIGHFIVIWSIYLEKKFEMEELLSYKKKKDDKKKKKARAEITDDDITVLADMLVHETGVCRPTFFDLLPFKIIRFSISFWSSLPARYRAHKARLEEEKRLKLEEELEQQEEEEAEQPRPRRRQRVTLPEAVADDDHSTWAGAPVINTLEAEEQEQEGDTIDIKSNIWTEEDFSRLSRAMVKFPGGTPKRWVKIAQELGMTVEMVTKQMKKIRQNQGVSAGDVSKSVGPGTPGKLIISRKGATISGEDVATKAYPAIPVTQNCVQDKVQNNSTPVSESSTTEPGRSNTLNDTDVWTQNHQKLLEMALQQYPRTTPDRWTWIARNVPGKTKEECIARYKSLVELMRQKKMQEKYDT